MPGFLDVTGMPLLLSFREVGGCFSTDIASLRDLKKETVRILRDAVQERKEQFQANAEASLQIIVFALVKDGKSDDGVAFLDFEKRNIAGVAEEDQQFMVALLSAEHGKITASIPDQSRITDK